MGRLEAFGAPTTLEPFGHPILVPLEADHGAGGPAAAAALRRDVAKAMEAYRVPGVPLGDAATPDLRRCVGMSHVDEGLAGSWAVRSSSALRTYEGDRTLMQLAAVWEEGEAPAALAPAGYDWEAFGTPRTYDKSRTEQAIQGACRRRVGPAGTPPERHVARWRCGSDSIARQPAGHHQPGVSRGRGCTSLGLVPVRLLLVSLA